MRVALLSSADSIHTARWANGLVAQGLDVHLISAHNLIHELDSRVNLYILPFKAPFAYILSVFSLRKLLKKIKPDILNVHYATGYGFLANISGFKPLLISVWGSDVYVFPYKSIVHKLILKANIKAATAVASTSKAMAIKLNQICQHSNVYITPFGIDENQFKLKKSDKKANIITIGTVKTLSHIYGIDVLIHAFSVVYNILNKPEGLFLEITGVGSDLQKLIDLTKELNVASQVIFHGGVQHKDVPKMLNRLDIFVALSRFESFGVSILEASSCELPVLVSDADGPSEVVIDGVTGFIVPRNDVDKTSIKLLELINNSKMRKDMGKAGREHVLTHYTWDISLQIMINAYQEISTKYHINKLNS